MANVADLRGYLKAAEAKERLKEFRQKSDKHKAAEIRKLVNFQATAMDAIRLERLIEPFHIPKQSSPIELTKTQTERIAELLAEKRTWLPE